MGEVLGTEIEVDVTGKVTEFDASKMQSFFGTDKDNDKSLIDNMKSLPETIGNSTDEWKANTAIMKEFGNAMPELVKSLRMMNDAVVRNTQNLPSIHKQLTSDEQKHKRIEELNRQNFLGFFNTGSNMIQGAANGNVGGSLISGVSGMSSTVNNLSQMANVSEMTNLAKGLMVGGGVLMAGAAVLKGGKALADAYKDAMPTIFDTGKAFGTTDSDMSMALYKDVNKFNNGTNLDNAAFNSLVVNLRKQGIGNDLVSPFAQAAEAGRIAETTAQWAYKTGGDVNQFANLAGIMSRYGGSTNVADDFNHLVSAGYASGLNDSQIPEFLSGIQKVMEDGIAKGFSRSATEVADTMLMFSKLSGNNAFWQGEQGAKLINQASAGLAGATAMSKTTDLIAFGAISRAFSTPELMKEALGNNKDLYMGGSSYVNEMMILEQGLNKGNFDVLMGGIYGSTADDKQRVERIRSTFGLNYTGARRVQNLYDKYQNKEYDANFEKELSAITDSPENQNDETAYRKSVNKIAEALQTMGQPVFNLELKAMDGIATDVSKIANFLVKPEGRTKEAKAQVNPVVNPMYTPKNQEFTEEYEEKKEEVNVLALENFDAAQKILLNDYTNQYWGNDSNGEHFEDAYNFVENYDSVNQLWPQTKPSIIKRTVGTGLTEKGRKKNLEENPYELAPFATEKDIDPLTTILGLPETHAKYQSLLAGGKVSPQDFMNAIAISKDASDAVRGATNSFDRQYSTKDLEKINSTLEKIFSELASGVTYTENK